MRIIGKDLCCLVNQQIKCSFCNTEHCDACGGKYGVAHHYIINMCRKRFFPFEVEWAIKCFLKRTKKKLKGAALLGDCIICQVYRDLEINDRNPIQVKDMNSLIWDTRCDHDEWIRRADERLR